MTGEPVCQSLSPAEHAHAYAAHARLPERVEPPKLPDVLRGPLERRAGLLGERVIGEDELRRVYDDWSRRADSRYRATTALRATRQLPPGRWIRIGVKDTIDVAGLPTGLGVRHHRTYPTRTALLVDALRPPDGDVVAKVVATELGIGLGSGCLNPYFPHLSPVGSSTGSAVAVAANICDLSIGSDVAGSVRWPAANCGLVGLRLTHDPALLSGSLPTAPFLEAIGLIARSGADLRYAMRGRLVDVSGEGPPVKRLAVPAELPLDACHPAVRTAFERGRELLATIGVRFVEASCQAWAAREAAWRYCAYAAAEIVSILDTWLDLPFQPATERALTQGRAVGDRAAARLLSDLSATRRAVRSEMASLGIDGWLLPVDPLPPRRLGPIPSERASIPSSDTDPDYEARLGFTPIASIAGLPAVVIPVYHDPTLDAPVGIQVIGRAHADAALVDLAFRIQRRDPFSSSERLPR
jgi:Asp-tRNA(Asn)/Glu-tRNA(Gln) amidotransferase A subunit family amidase